MARRFGRFRRFAGRVRNRVVVIRQRFKKRRRRRRYASRKRSFLKKRFLGLPVWLLALAGAFGAYKLFPGFKATVDKLLGKK